MKNPAKIKAFGAHLRQLREKAKMSQEELSNSADLDKRTLQRIETGQSVASLDTLLILADTFGIPLKKLVDF